MRSTGSPSCRVCLISRNPNPIASAGGELGQLAPDARGHSKRCDEAAQPSTHAHPAIRRACQWHGQMRVSLRACSLGTPACGSAYRRAPVAGRSHGADCPGRASDQWRCVPAARQSNKNAAEKVMPGQTGSPECLAGNCAARLNSPQSMAPSLASKPWLWVHQASGGIWTAGRHAGSLQLPSSTGRVSGPTRPHHPQPVRAVAGHIHRNGGLGRVERTARPEVLAQALTGCTLTFGAGGACPSRLKSSCCTMPQWPVAKQRQSDYKPHGMHRRQLAPADGGLAAGSAVSAGRSIALSCSRRSGTQGRVWSKRRLQAGSSSKKGNVFEHVPFTGNAACGLN